MFLLLATKRNRTATVSNLSAYGKNAKIKIHAGDRFSSKQELISVLQYRIWSYGFDVSSFGELEPNPYKMPRKVDGKIIYLPMW